MNKNVMKGKLPRSKVARAIPPNKVIPDKRNKMLKEADLRVMWYAASRFV
jgi:hypothetical protein